MHLNIPRNSHQFDQSDERINRWLEERQALVIALNNLSKLKPFKNPYLIKEEAEQFTALLIDYVSAGQFEIFETIFKAAEKAPNQTGLKSSVMVALLRTTNHALDFADKYTQKTWPLESLEGDLNALAENLASRLELEDHLIELYAQATSILEKSD